MNLHDVGDAPASPRRSFREWYEQYGRSEDYQRRWFDWSYPERLVQEISMVRNQFDRAGLLSSDRVALLVSPEELYALRRHFVSNEYPNGIDIDPPTGRMRVMGVTVVPTR